MIEHDGKSVTLAMTSADGEEGYPGSVDVVCCYSLEAPGTIRIELEATTDAPTVVNLAQHSYFNLCGDEDILDHRLLIHADTFTPVDGNKIPTGNIAPVADTPYDFRDLRRLRCDDGTARTEYDINFVVGEKRAKAPCPIARLEAPRGDLMLEVLSTEPGVQFYDGCMMPEIPVPGLDGRRYGRNSGCCLEPQLFPDSANHPAFCSAVLRPSQTYRQTTLLSFSHR